MKSRLVEFQPGVFARVGDELTIDGRRYRFTADGWEPRWSTEPRVVHAELHNRAVRKTVRDGWRARWL